MLHAGRTWWKQRACAGYAAAGSFVREFSRPMLQAAPQFTPFRLLDAGRRAEAEGRMDAAFQLYRHTADQYAYSAEAAAAREGLARLQNGWAPNIWHLNGTPPQPAEGGA